MDKRTRARELAMQGLYQLDVQGDSAFAGLGMFFREDCPDKRVLELAENWSQDAWKNVTACDELKGGEFTHDKFDELLKISQDGDTVRMEGFGILYEGKVQEIAAGGSMQGEAVLGACGGIEETETVRIQRIVTQGDEGSFDATSIYESDEFFPGIRTFCTCK